jgi:hypothetical protein
MYVSRLSVGVFVRFEARQDSILRPPACKEESSPFLLITQFTIGSAN